MFALLRWSLGSGGRRWATGGAAAAVGLLLFVGSLSAPFEWAAAHGQTNEGVYGAFGLDYRISCELEERASGELLHYLSHPVDLRRVKDFVQAAGLLSFD